MVRQPTKTKLNVKVVPGASNTEISGWLGEALKIRVSKPPEKGKANREVEALICSSLEIPTGSVRIVKGRTSARKVIEVNGLSLSQIKNILRAKDA